MLRFHKVGPLVALIGACGGEISIGTRAPDGESHRDGQGGATAPPSNVSIYPSTPPAPESCPAGTGEEPLYDLATTGDDDVSDFFGDGSGAFAGVNYWGSARTGRIVRLPASQTPVIADLSPFDVESLAPALDRVVFSVTGAGQSNFVGAVPRSGGPLEKEDVAGDLSLLAGHPARAEAVYVEKAGSGIGTIRLWKPPAPSFALFNFTAAQSVRSLSMSATSIVAVVQDTAAAVPTFDILRIPQQADPIAHEVVATVQASSVSNVVADGDSAVLAAYDQTVAKFVVYRFPSTGQSLATAERIGEVDAIVSDNAHIELDATHVYLARTPGPPCDGPGCPVSHDVFRMKKDGPSPSNTAVKVKTFGGADPFFVGPSNPRSHAFKVDACWFYWYDTAKRVFYRQPKSKL